MSLDAVLAYLDSNTVSRAALEDGSGVVVDVEGQLVFVLNETGQFVVEALRSGCRDEKDIASRLAVSFKVDAEMAREDVHAFIAEVEGCMGAPALAANRR